MLSQKVTAKGLVYLASPYTHKDQRVVFARFCDICTIAGKLFNLLSDQPVSFYSPIAHGHPIAKSVHLPTSFQWWKEHNHRILSRCDELWVVMLDGWKDSKGVADEIKFAWSLGIRIRYVDPKEWILRDPEEM